MYMLKVPLLSACHFATEGLYHLLRWLRGRMSWLRRSSKREGKLGGHRNLMKRDSVKFVAACRL